MTLTIILDTKTEERLRADAQAQGRAPEELAAEHVAAMYGTATAQRFDPELIAALGEGIADIEAGREVDFADHLEQRRATRAMEAAEAEAA